MDFSMPKNELLDYIVKQINLFFPDGKTVKKTEIQTSFEEALQRTEFCFSKINIKYFRKNNCVMFDHLHADQYAMFLYFFSNTLYRNEGSSGLCTKLFQLNRYLHGIDALYEVELPEIFLFVHPLGTVLGRATYSNYFIVYQQCNIGSNHDNYPILQEHITMHPGSSILGNCRVSSNCKIGAGSLLLDRDLEQNSLYIGNPRDFIIKKVENPNPVWTY
jgi:serine O-acetyltransferase